MDDILEILFDLERKGILNKGDILNICDMISYINIKYDVDDILYEIEDILEYKRISYCVY